MAGRRRWDWRLRTHHVLPPRPDSTTRRQSALNASHLTAFGRASHSAAPESGSGDTRPQRAVSPIEPPQRPWSSLAVPEARDRPKTIPAWPLKNASHSHNQTALRIKCRQEFGTGLSFNRGILFPPSADQDALKTRRSDLRLIPQSAARMATFSLWQSTDFVSPKWAILERHFLETL